MEAKGGTGVTKMTILVKFTLLILRYAYATT